MRIPGRALAGAVAVAAFAAGCGGGGDGGERLTKEQYIGAADAICAEVNQQLDALGEPGSFEEVVELAEAAIAIQEDALGQLRALNPPEADESTLNGAYDLLDQQVALGNELADAARDRNAARITEIVAELDGIDNQADQIARDYGLQECGTD
jgi:hypothetical protein